MLLRKVCIDFYENLLGSLMSVGRISLMKKFLYSSQRRSDSSKEALQRNVIAIEIQESMFSIGDDKAPSLYGFTSHSFKKK